MDAPAIFIQWKNGQLPTIAHIQAAMLTGDVRGLELVATMYLQARRTIKAMQIFSDDKYLQLLLEAVPKTWTPKVVKVLSITLPSKYPQLDLYFESIKQFGQPNNRQLDNRESKTSVVEPSTSVVEPSTPRINPRNSTTSNIIQSVNHVEDVDLIMANRQKPSVWVLVRMLNASVPIEWVQQCASKLTIAIRQEQVEQDAFVLLDDDNTRHVHHIDNSVTSFMRVLHSCMSVDTSPSIITWQFSQSKQQSKHAIHLQQLAERLKQLCPTKPIEFAIFACSLGLPTTKLMKTRDCIERWKHSRFNTLSFDIVIKMLLRPFFLTSSGENETSVLFIHYLEHIQEFICIEDNKVDDVEKFFFQQYYSYPTRDEMKYIWSRIEKNANMYK